MFITVLKSMWIFLSTEGNTEKDGEELYPNASNYFTRTEYSNREQVATVYFLDNVNFAMNLVIDRFP